MIAIDFLMRKRKIDSKDVGFRRKKSESFNYNPFSTFYYFSSKEKETYGRVPRVPLCLKLIIIIIIITMWLAPLV